MTIMKMSNSKELYSPYYKTWSKVSHGLKLMLSPIFSKRVTVTYT
jgi:hypothetical protein